MIKSSSQKFDFNLINFLVVIVETRSMVAASEKLNVAPAAVSYAVSKLRHYFNDPLFIRAFNGVTPTALALNLYDQFKPIVDLLDRSVQRAPGLYTEPGRKIFIRASPLAEMWITHELMKNKQIADNFTVEFCFSTMHGESRVQKLRTQEVDINIGTAMALDSRIKAFRLFDTGVSVICRRDYPGLDNQITLKQYVEGQHISITEGINDNNILGEMDILLSQRLHTPFIRTESFLNLLQCVSVYNLLSLLPTFYLPAVQRCFPIKALDCDFIPAKRFELYAFVHTSKQNDPLLMRLISLLLNSDGQ